MSIDYRRKPSKDDFLRWAQMNQEAYKEFFDEFILPTILDLEQDDYFGTEGFDKRFA